MKSFYESVRPDHNPNWPYIPDHPYKTFMVRGSGPEKTLY